MTGWLVEQLPAVLRGDPVVAPFARVAEELGDTLRSRIDGFERDIDLEYAEPAMLIYLGAWIGVTLDRADEAEVMRDIIRAAGRTLTLRGTRQGLVELLESVTGGSVTVEDHGGVFGPQDSVPAYRPRVEVRLTRTGPLGLDRLRVLLQQELPIGATLELTAATDGESA